MRTTLITAKDLHFSYGSRKALQGLSFDIEEGELFSVMGPNGGGKSTTFKILSTLLAPQKGSVEFWGEDIAKQTQKIRPQIGVVFQSPALDKKLTVQENLIYHGKLFGLSASLLKKRAQDLLRRFSISERAHEKVEKLSGGLKRRVEIAKSLLNQPRILILDEPTTGLDPVSRMETWGFLRELQKETGLTIIFTTHLMDEAEKSDRTLLLHEGRALVCGKPEELKSSLSGDVISLKVLDPNGLKTEIERRFSIPVKQVEEELRIEKKEGAQFIPSLVEAFPKQIQSITLGKPTLEDLFVHFTGQRFIHKGEA